MLHREQHPEIFARFLTLGGEAIPKVVVIIGRLGGIRGVGANANACRQLIAQGKACGDVGLARKLVAALRRRSEQRCCQQELYELICLAATDRSELEKRLR